MKFEIQGQDEQKPVSVRLVMTGGRLDVVFEKDRDKIHAICIGSDGRILLNASCNRQLRDMGFAIDSHYGGIETYRA